MWRETLDRLSAAVLTCFASSCNDSRGTVPATLRRAPRMRFETLEPRLLLSADLLPDGVLHILGTEEDDSVRIQQFDPPTGGDPLLEVVLNGESFEFNLAGINTIKAELLDGNDALTAGIASDIDWDLTLGEGNDRTQIEVRIGDRFADARYRIDAGDGDNQTDVRFGDGVHGAVPPSDRSNIIAEYRSGAGNDRLTFDGLVHLDRDLHIGANVATGGGDDSVAWDHQFEFRSGKWAQTDYNFELGDGNDQFEANLLNQVGLLNVAGGAGNDFLSAHARWDAGAGDQVLDFAALFQSGAGNDEVSLDLIVSPRDPASGQGDFLDLSTEVDLGPGTDLSRISTSIDATRWLAQLAVNIVDFVDEDEITTEFNTAIAAQAEDGTLDLDITGRDGNDTVELNVDGTFDEFNALIGTGEGNDEIRHKFFSIVDRSRISIQTGGGNDLVDSNVSAVWLTTGFFEVNAGDGDNVVNLNVASAIPPEGTAFHNPKSFQIISAGGNDTVNASFIDAFFDLAFMADTGEGDD